jgi:4-amino-4-deoxy-L-arabinose transferase-like glycosyltransferase
MLRSLFSFIFLLPRRLRSGHVPLSITVAVVPIVALVAPIYYFLSGLNAFPLRDNNEGLYAEIAREMLADGQWIIPHLNGVPYIEKPPLLYWIEAGAMFAFGATPGAARLASGLPMMALCLGLYAFGRRHAGRRVGCLASVILSSMVPVALCSHLALFDPLLCALLGGALLCYLHGMLGRSVTAHRIAACLLALAVLEKGAVALVLALGIVCLFLLPAEHRRLLWHPTRGTLALFLLVALPWHVLAALRHPGFAWFYVVNEHVLRFMGRRQPDDYHHGPLWFYLPRLAMMLVPWTPFLALRTPLGNGGTRGILLRFCAAATAFPVMFFSLSQAKADYYLIVCSPFLALGLALVLDAAIENTSFSTTRLEWCWAVAVASCIVALVALPGSEHRMWSPLLITLLSLGWLGLLAICARFFSILQTATSREVGVLAIAVLAAPVVC